MALSLLWGPFMALSLLYMRALYGFITAMGALYGFITDIAVIYGFFTAIQGGPHFFFYQGSKVSLGGPDYIVIIMFNGTLLAVPLQSNERKRGHLNKQSSLFFKNNNSLVDKCNILNQWMYE